MGWCLLCLNNTKPSLGFTCFIRSWIYVLPFLHGFTWMLFILFCFPYPQIWHAEGLHWKWLFGGLIEERAGLAGAVTVASSLDYGVGDSSLKMLLPLVSAPMSYLVYDIEYIFSITCWKEEVKVKLSVMTWTLHRMPMCWVKVIYPRSNLPIGQITFMYTLIGIMYMTIVVILDRHL